MEEIGTTNPKYQPLRVLWRRSCVHAQKTIPLAPIHSFTKQIVRTFNVSRFVDLKSFDIHATSIPHAPYKLPPSIKNILGARRFFFSFHFQRTLFCGLAEAGVSPGRFSLFVHSLVCQITCSFLNGFHPNLCQHFSHACSTCRTIFNLKKTFECI